MSELAELQAKCRELGVPSSLIRRHMNDADALESLIEGFEKGKAHVKSVRRREKMKMARPVAKAKARGKARPKRIVLKSEPQAEAKPKRGRRPASGNSAKATTRRPTKATARKAAPVRKATVKAAPKRQARKNEAPGREMLGKLNFKRTQGWNPREGSIVDDIFQALKQTNGDRDKTYTLLLKWANLSEWIPTKKPNGQKRTKAEQEAMLRYRIARTLWDFAIQTGQHTKSENRAEYGSGNGNAKPAPAPRRGRPSKKAEAKPAARRGRPTTKATAKKTTSTRRKATAGRRRR